MSSDIKYYFNKHPGWVEKRNLLLLMDSKFAMYPDELADNVIDNMILKREIIERDGQVRLR